MLLFPMGVSVRLGRRICSPISSALQPIGVKSFLNLKFLFNKIKNAVLFYLFFEHLFIF